MAIRLLGFKLAVTLVDKEERKSGIVLSDGAESTIVKGKVEYVGTTPEYIGTYMVYPTTPIGKIIIFNKVNSVKITDNETDYYVLSEKDVLAIVE